MVVVLVVLPPLARPFVRVTTLNRSLRLMRSHHHQHLTATPVVTVQ